MSFEMKDSGAREEFGTGAVRDIREGKGRYDLISPFALKRLAIVYEKGAQKYSIRNWEAGMPHTRYYDSATRHLLQWLMGDADEDHLAHAMWNVAAIMHMQETHPGLDDRPNWKPKAQERKMVHESNLYYKPEICQWVIEDDGIIASYGGTPEEALKNYTHVPMEAID